jgi:hypothetical protein
LTRRREEGRLNEREEKEEEEQTQVPKHGGVGQVSLESRNGELCRQMVEQSVGLKKEKKDKKKK